jgi:HK97 gp10 family phage protein
MTVTVKLRGIPELKADLALLRTAAQGRLLANASMAMARVAARHARALVPVATGSLRDSIKARKDPADRKLGRISAYANAAARHAHLIEYGTLPRRTKTGHYTGSAPAHSYMRKAVDENIGEIEAKMVQNLAVGIDRELKKSPPPEDQGEL